MLSYSFKPKNNIAVSSYTLRNPTAEVKGFTSLGCRKLLVNGKNNQITNFSEAKQFVKRFYLNGWKLT